MYAGNPGVFMPGGLAVEPGALFIPILNQSQAQILEE